MLRTLSYLNLIIAVLYFLNYLQNGSPVVISGLIAVLVFNWMVLRNLEREELKWPLLQKILGVASFLFALYLLYGAVNLLSAALEYYYFPLDTILLLVSGFLFALTILFHVFKSVSALLIKKTD